MLVLTRRQGQSILLIDGDKDIEIVVCRASEPVRIGINAPKDVNIFREEKFQESGQHDVLP